MKPEKIKDHYSDDVRLALLEQSINNINNTLIRFEKRFDHLDNELKEMRYEIKLDFRWVLVIICELANIMAYVFHWF